MTPDDQPIIQGRVTRPDGRTPSHRQQDINDPHTFDRTAFAIQLAYHARVGHRIPDDEPLTIAVWFRTLGNGVHYRDPVPDDATVFTFTGNVVELVQE